METNPVLPIALKEEEAALYIGYSRSFQRTHFFHHYRNTLYRFKTAKPRSSARVHFKNQSDNLIEYQYLLNLSACVFLVET